MKHDGLAALAEAVDRHDTAIRTAHAYGTRTAAAQWDSALWDALCADIDSARKELDGMLAAARPSVASGLSAESERLEFLLKNELAVHRMQDTGGYMLVSIEGDPYDGSEYGSPRDAIDYARAGEPT